MTRPSARTPAWCASRREHSPRALARRNLSGFPLDARPYPADCVGRWDVGPRRTGFRLLPKDGVAGRGHNLKGERPVVDDNPGVLAALVLTLTY